MSDMDLRRIRGESSSMASTRTVSTLGSDPNSTTSTSSALAVSQKKTSTFFPHVISGTNSTQLPISSTSSGPSRSPFRHNQELRNVNIYPLQPADINAPTHAYMATTSPFDSPLVQSSVTSTYFHNSPTSSSVSTINSKNPATFGISLPVHENDLPLNESMTMLSINNNSNRSLASRTLRSSNIWGNAPRPLSSSYEDEPTSDPYFSSFSAMNTLLIDDSILKLNLISPSSLNLNSPTAMRNRYLAKVNSTASFIPTITPDSANKGNEQKRGEMKERKLKSSKSKAKSRSKPLRESSPSSASLFLSPLPNKRQMEVTSQSDSPSTVKKEKETEGANGNDNKSKRENEQVNDTNRQTETVSKTINEKNAKNYHTIIEIDKDSLLHKTSTESTTFPSFPFNYSFSCTSEHTNETPKLQNIIVNFPYNCSYPKIESSLNSSNLFNEYLLASENVKSTYHEDYCSTFYKRNHHGYMFIKEPANSLKINSNGNGSKSWVQLKMNIPIDYSSSKKIKVDIRELPCWKPAASSSSKLKRPKRKDSRDSASVKDRKKNKRKRGDGLNEVVCVA